MSHTSRIAASLSHSRRPCRFSLSSKRMTKDNTWNVLRDMVAGNIDLPVSAFQRLAVASSFDLYTCTLACKSVTSKSAIHPSKFIISSILFSTGGVMKSSNADFISWTWLTAYLVGPGTILMTLAALSLPCHSCGERDHNNFTFLEGNVSAGG